MYKPLLIFLSLVLSNVALADQEAIQNVYATYVKQKEAFFSSELNLTNINKKTQAFLKAAEAAHEKIIKLEVDIPDEEELSAEGGQIAYDIQLLAPLVDFAASAKKPADCAASKHDSMMQQDDQPETMNVAVLDILAKLCK